MNRPDLAEQVKKDYGIDCAVEHIFIDSNNYEVTIVSGGKTIKLRETMKNGMTKLVVLTTDVSKIYKKYHEAEADGIEYLKGNHGDN